MHSVIVIVGPTASGKTALGVRLAKRFRGVVISADSRQVYRGLDRCFATVTKREMGGVRHYLLRFVPLKQRYTAGDYARDFQRALKRIPRRTPVFLVGGSPFYIEAALHPEQLANVKPNLALRRRLASRTLPQLLAQLKRHDAQRYAAIDRHNRRRIERAIEIVAAPTPPPTPNSQLPLRVLTIGLHLPRKRLYTKMDARVDQRLAHGMLDEVQRAHRRGVSWQRLESLGLEPRFLARILRGQLTRDDSVRQLKYAIHDFVRRQLTWWRRDDSIHWVRSPAQAERRTRKFLKAGKRLTLNT